MSIPKISQEELDAAKEAIAKEFIDSYYEFLEEVRSGKSQTIEFGRKYGFTLTDEGVKDRSKDSAKTLVWFQSRVFSGRWLQDWEAVGYSRYLIWELYKQGFLSNKEYYNWNARATGRTSFYYVSQKVAKEIYKASKR